MAKDRDVGASTKKLGASFLADHGDHSSAIYPTALPSSYFFGRDIDRALGRLLANPISGRGTWHPSSAAGSQFVGPVLVRMVNDRD